MREDRYENDRDEKGDGLESSNLETKRTENVLHLSNFVRGYRDDNNRRIQTFGKRLLC